MRSGCSAVQISDTHKMAHRVRLLRDPQWNHIEIEPKYVHNKLLPSPVMMAAYEEPTDFSDTAFFLGHKEILPSTE